MLTGIAALVKHSLWAWLMFFLHVSIISSVSEFRPVMKMHKCHIIQKTEFEEIEYLSQICIALYILYKLIGILF